MGLTCAKGFAWRGIMPEPNELNAVIVSDLHLSEGLNRETRKFNLNEDFFFDEKFDRFLKYLQQQSVKRKRKWRLIIAGDMADFLQVTRLPGPFRFQRIFMHRSYPFRSNPAPTSSPQTDSWPFEDIPLH